MTFGHIFQALNRVILQITKQEVDIASNDWDNIMIYVKNDTDVDLKVKLEQNVIFFESVERV